MNQNGRLLKTSTLSGFFSAKPRTYSKILDGSARTPFFLQFEIVRHANLNRVWFLFLPPFAQEYFSENHMDAAGIEPA